MSSVFTVFTKGSRSKSKRMGSRSPRKSPRSPSSQPSVEDSVVSDDSLPKHVETMALSESTPPKVVTPMAADAVSVMTLDEHEIKLTLNKARDALERRLKEAQDNLEHARNEDAIADSDYDRLCQEEVQAKGIYESTPPNMERYVKSSLKQYWRLTQKRKKAATRTKAAAEDGVEEAQEHLEWTLQDALDKISLAREGKLSANYFDPPKKKLLDFDIKDLGGDSGDYVNPYAEEKNERPSMMFGTFDAKAYLERMEEEATDIETDDEGV